MKQKRKYTFTFFESDTKILSFIAIMFAPLSKSRGDNSEKSPLLKVKTLPVQKNTNSIIPGYVRNYIETGTILHLWIDIRINK